MKIKDLAEQLNKHNPEAEVQMKLVDCIIPVDGVEASEYIGIVYLICED